MTTTVKQRTRKEHDATSCDEWPVIHTDSRSEAIAHGVLIPVDERLSRDAGFKVPVALTQAVHERYVRVPPGVRLKDETGRLWDILTMTCYAFAAERCCDPIATVELFVRNDNRAPRRVKLKACLGPGDKQGETVLTIMLPTES